MKKKKKQQKYDSSAFLLLKPQQQFSKTYKNLKLLETIRKHTHTKGKNIVIRK